MATKTLEQWEKQKGFIVIGGDPSAKMTEEEVDAIDLGKKHGVNHADRINFLRQNGYEVTRENMVADLSAQGGEK